MFPKRSNPWLLAQSTAIVSRAQVEDGGEDGKARDSTGKGSSGLLAALDELASRSVFGLKRENDPDYNDVRKRKKRKTESKEEKKRAGANDAQLTAFRLLSSNLPPTPISLAPKPLPSSKFREPVCEDTEADACLRRKRAVQVAVDAAWIVQEAGKSYTQPRRNGGRILVEAQASSQISNQYPAMAILQRNRPLSLSHFPIKHLKQPRILNPTFAVEPVHVSAAPRATPLISLMPSPPLLARRHANANADTRRRRLNRMRKREATRRAARTLAA